MDQSFQTYVQYEKQSSIVSIRCDALVQVPTACEDRHVELILSVSDGLVSLSLARLLSNQTSMVHSSLELALKKLILEFC